MSPKAIKLEDPRTVLKRHGLKPKRSWGQNFLVSEKAVREITEACLIQNDALKSRVIEIGAGVGTLTQALLAEGLLVIAIERDRDMCQVLRHEFNNVKEFELVEGDAVTVDYHELLGDTKGIITGNLPYQLTGKLIRAVINAAPQLHRAVLMVQQEVAQRLIAAPGDSARGALSAIVQSRFEVKTILKLKPTAFHPPPAVRSTVLSLTPLKVSSFYPVAPELFDRIVNCAFANRRKTLRNSLLASEIGWDIPKIEQILADAEIDPKLRPERLSVADFCRMTKAAATQ